MRYINLKSNVKVHKLPKWIDDNDLKNIFSIFRKNNAELLIVGGAVRSILLETQDKIKNIDIDLVTNLLPEKVVLILSENNLKCLPTSIKYGTVCVILENLTIQITTLRKDLKSYGRHAEVKFLSNWEEDAKRRDFTMNAIYMDLKGNIYDPVGGYDDLKKGIVKFIGKPENRISEDYLRMLRFIRFSSIYSNQSHDKDAIKALKLMGRKIKNLSSERILSELVAIFSKSPRIKKDAVSLFNKTNLDLECLGVKFNKNGLDTFQKITKIKNWMIALACLTYEQKDCLKNFPLSRNDRKYWEELNRKFTKPELTQLLSKKWKKSVFLIGGLVRERFILNSIKNENNIIRSKEIYNFFPPDFPIKGKDLILRGLKSDRNIGESLTKLKLIWCDSEFSLKKSQLIEYL